MRLTRIRAADFRNLAFADVSTDAPRVFLLGDNGQGKTNLLEAAGLISAFRSFRTTEIAPLIRADIYRSIESMKAAGLSILVIDKDVKALTRVADRHYVMEHGRVVDMIENDRLEASMDKLHDYLGV